MNIRILVKAVLAIVWFSSATFGQVEAGKSITVTISGVPAEEKGRIDGSYPVSAGGTINMPFIGQVQAAGMSPEGLAQALQGRYKSQGIYTNPTIQVVSSVEGGKVNEQTVTIGGQVRRPGPVPYSRELTLWMAIQAAGGPTEFGAKNRVTLFRAGTQKSYDLNQPKFMQIPLQPNDTVEMPEKNFLGR